MGLHLTGSQSFQSAILGSGVFVSFISDLDPGMQCILSKFADDTEVGGDSLEGQEALQRNLTTNSTRTNAGFYTAPRVMPYISKIWEVSGLKRSPAEGGLEGADDSKLSTSQCALVAKGANTSLESVKYSTASPSEEMILLLYLALVQPHVEYELCDSTLKRMLRSFESSRGEQQY